MRNVCRANSVATVMITQTIATTSTSCRVSLARSETGRRDGRSAGGFEDIAGAPHRVDHRLPAGVDLLAQVGNVELDDVGLAAEVVAPHAIEDLGLGEHPPRVAHQEPEQLELGGSQGDPLAA